MAKSLEHFASPLTTVSSPHHPDTYAKVINIISPRGLGINLSTQIVRKLAFTLFTDFISRETVRN
jgi:hypothetical protein